MESRKWETAFVGGGCFWCMEASLSQIKGILKVESGHMGGKEANPTYEAVCKGETGHAEAVRIEFDPSVISYSEVLEVFFSAHDPTTLDRQGDDVGRHYRSVIFQMNERQGHEARQVIARLTEEEMFDAPIVTSIEPAGVFWKAEDYHQNYFANNPEFWYCKTDIAPKVAKVRAKFADRLKPMEAF